MVLSFWLFSNLHSRYLAQTGTQMSKANNVFISWSGERSKIAAQALKEWLPMVIQAVEPWMSDADIDKGSRGLSEISSALGAIKVGIVCLTPENQDAPWLNYEAGALSKTIDEKTRLCTYLLSGLTPEQVMQPLGMFQHARADKEDTRKLVHSINAAVSDTPMPEARLDNLFEKLWPSLEKDLSAVPSVVGKTVKKRPTDEMVAELLDLVRSDVSRRREERGQIESDWQVRFHHLVTENTKLQAELMKQRKRAASKAPFPAFKSKPGFMVRYKDGRPDLVVQARDYQEVEPGHFTFTSASGDVIEEVEGVQEVSAVVLMEQTELAAALNASDSAVNPK